jgi:hypothetical protein
MKILIIIATILILSFFAFADEWHPEQGAHFVGELGLTVVTYKIALDCFHLTKWQSLISGIVVASLIGIGKETLMDSKIGEKDLIVDAAGIATGAGILMYFEFDGEFKNWK